MNLANVTSLYSHLYDDDDENKPSFDEFARSYGVESPQQPDRNAIPTTDDLIPKFLAAYNENDPNRPSFERWADFYLNGRPLQFTTSQPATAQPTSGMTFEQAMMQFPGLYTEADRGQFEAAQRAQQAQNAIANYAASNPALSPAAQQAIQQVKQSGLQNNYDLAGTGYSSVAYQQSLPKPEAPLPMESAGFGTSPVDPPVMTLSGGWTGAGIPGAGMGPTPLPGGNPNPGDLTLGTRNDPGLATTAAITASNGGLSSYGPSPTIQPGGVTSGPGTVLSGNGYGGGSIGPSGTTQLGANGNPIATYTTTSTPQGGGAPAQTSAGGGSMTTNPTSANTNMGLPGTVPISWPTNGAGEGPNYAGNVRNIGAELGAISSYINPFAQQSYNLARELNPLYTQLNTSNYQDVLGSLSGSMRNSFDQANPWFNNSANMLNMVREHLNQNGQPASLTAATYDAATAAPTTAPQAATSTFGGSIFGPQSVSAQTGDIGLMTAANRLQNGGPSQIQQTLEQQAMGDLNRGGALSPEEVRSAQQAAREGWSARGLVNSNGAVAEEVLNRNALERQRLNEARGFAQGVDATGFAQRQQGFSNALGLSGASQGYAGMGLQAQLANQGNIFNYANLANANNQFNTGQQNQMAQFGAQLGQQNNQFNAAAQNQAGQFNAGQTNIINPFNVQSGMEFGQRGFNNALSQANFTQSGAVNPFAVAGSLMGQGADYAPNLIGYGGDLFNTNYNAARAAEINADNVSAGKTAGWLAALGSLFGGAGAAIGGIKCWVAREVYGEANPRWKLFRSWLENRAPEPFHDLYVEHGEAFAEFIKDKPSLKAAIRDWMDARVSEYVNGEPTAPEAFANLQLVEA